MAYSIKQVLILILFLLFATYSFAELKNNVISRSACGLKVIHKDIEITDRHEKFKGNPMPIAFNISELPDSCYVIDNAFLWWTVSYKVKLEEPRVEVTFGNEVKNFKAKITGEAGLKCWVEKGTLGYRADITDAFTGNGVYYISVETSQNETDGLTLLIIYRDLNSKTEGHLFIRDGLITKGDETNFQDTTQILDGFNACDNSDSAWGLVVISDIQGADFSYQMIINGESYPYQPKFWNSELIQTNIKKGQTSALFGVGAVYDCYSWLLMGLYFQTSTCTDCIPDKHTYANFKDTLVCQDSEILIKGFGADKYIWLDEDDKIISRNKEFTYKATKNAKIIIQGLFNDCGIVQDTLTIRVIKKPEISILNNPLESTCVMTPKNFKVKIRNNSFQNEKIEGIQLKYGTNFILTSSFNFPFDLPSNKELDIEIEFKPQMIGKISDTLIIQINNQCQAFFPIYLNGEGLINNSFVSLPDTIAIIGLKDFQIPLKGRLICDIYDSVLISYNGIISFDLSAFEPEISKSTNIIQSYIQDGRRIIKVIGTIFNIIDSTSTLAVLSGTVLHGKNRTTPLIIEDFKWEDSAVDIVKINGSLTVDACVYNLGKILLLKNIDFNLIPNPADNKVKAEILNLPTEQGTSNLVHLKVFNSMGNQVFAKELPDIVRDKIDIDLDLSGFASGLYNFVLESDSRYISKQLLIIR